MQTEDFKKFLGQSFLKARVVLQDQEFEQTKHAIVQKGGAKFLKSFGISKFTCYQYLSGRRNLPLSVLLEVRAPPTNLYVKFGASSSKAVRIPSMDNSDVAYLSGVLRDGWIIQVNGKLIGLGVQPGSSLGWKKAISNAFFQAFEVKPAEYGDEMIVYSEIIARYFHEFFEMPLHSQSSWEVPSQILNGTPEQKNGFIAGFFDAEGCCFVKGNDKRIMLDQNSWKSLYQIRAMLEEIGIQCGKIIKDKRTNNHRITISQRTSLERFAKLIPSRHPEKIRKLSLLIPEETTKVPR